jgi:hypothetical protein
MLGPCAEAIEDKKNENKKVVMKIKHLLGISLETHKKIMFMLVLK